MDEAPDFLRQVVPNVHELWDPTLPPNLNIARIVRGDGTVSHPRLQRIHTDYSNSFFAAAKSRQMEHAQTEVRENRHVADFEDIIHALRIPAPSDLQSPLRALQEQVTNVFRHGPLRAGGMFASLSAAAESGLTTVQTPDYDVPIPWNSCKAAATLVAILACRSDSLHEVLKFQSRRLGGLPSYETIRYTPSASLQTAFRNAKLLARGEGGISSLIVVSLTDVHIFEMAKQGRSQDYTSFAHTFVVGIGPEGVNIWQGWGEHGYGLDQNISVGGSRIRNWQEAGDFVDRFEKFVAYKVCRLCMFHNWKMVMLSLVPGQMGCEAKQALQAMLRC